MIQRIQYHKELVVFVLVAAAVVLTFLSDNNQAIYSMTAVGLLSISTIGLNILIGQAGQVNFAASTFMAFGGYGVAILSTAHGWTPICAAVVSALATALFSIIIGLPLLRLRGHYLAVATFAVALAFESIASGARSITGGTMGIAGIPPLSIGSYIIDSSRKLFVLSWFCCGIALLIFVVLDRSYIGRAWRALSVNEDVARSLGIEISRLKLLAFVLSAVFGAVSGSLYVEFTSFISSDLFGLSFVINMFLMLFIGGRGSALGPVVGTIIIVTAPQLFSNVTPQLQNSVFLVLLLAIILLWPQGVLGRRLGVAPLSALLPHWISRPSSRKTRRSGEVGASGRTWNEGLK